MVVPRRLLGEYVDPVRLRRPGCHGTAEQLGGLMPRAGFLEFGGLHKEPRLDEAEGDRQFPQLKGLFMIDRDGVVRWSDVECAAEGPAGVGKIPSAEEIAAAARTLAG